MKKYAALITCAALMFSLSSCGKKDTAQTTAPENMPEAVDDGTYLGSLSPVSEVKVVSDGKGQIVECPYEIGDTISAGALLYRLDSDSIRDSITTCENSIKKSNLSIKTAQENVSNMKIFAPAGGILKDFSIREGERVNATDIGEIYDESECVASVPFTGAQKARIKVGDRATVTSAELMGSASGTVTRIYDARSDAVSGADLYDVEITLANTGAFYNGLSVGASVNGIDSPESGVIKAVEAVPVVSRSTGNAAKVYVHNGERVKKGQLLVELENTSLNATLSRAKLDKSDLEVKLASLKKDYAATFVYAPAAGTITAKHKKLGDNITSSTESIMTISDTSKLVMKVNVDKAESSALNVGDSVMLTAVDDGATYPAQITKIDDTAASDTLVGVTITMDNTAGLDAGLAVSVKF